MSDDVTIIIKITPEGFDEHFSIDEWLNLGDMTNKDVYDKMLHFVVDANGQAVSVDEARALFRKIPKKDWPVYIGKFYQAVADAFVSPTNGGG